MVIYYLNNLNIFEDLKWNIHQDFEAVWLNITIRSQSTLLGCLYRPSKSTTLYSDLHDLLNKIWVKRKNVILLGDFNCNLFANTADTDQDAPYDSNRMKRILRRFGYFNIIESPTRITANSKSLIDLITVSPNLQASNVLAGSIDLGISDHQFIYAAFSTRRNYKDLDNIKLQRNVKVRHKSLPWINTEIRKGISV